MVGGDGFQRIAHLRAVNARNAFGVSADKTPCILALHSVEIAFEVVLVGHGMHYVGDTILVYHDTYMRVASFRIGHRYNMSHKTGTSAEEQVALFEVHKQAIHIAMWIYLLPLASYC
jgi:hypothetical protein